jgi:hypothetical protein
MCHRCKKATELECTDNPVPSVHICLPRPFSIPGIGGKFGTLTPLGPWGCGDGCQWLFSVLEHLPPFATGAWVQSVSSLPHNPIAFITKDSSRNSYGVLHFWEIRESGFSTQEPFMLSYNDLTPSQCERSWWLEGGWIAFLKISTKTS